MSTTAWLIETADPIGVGLYFCADGDWCSNPNHAHKFQTAEQAHIKLASLQVSANFKVTEHEWVDHL